MPPLNGPRSNKTHHPGFVNNKCAEQPTHPHRLISAFVIRSLESIISKLATGKISFFYLVSVAGETCLSLALSETLKRGLVAKRPKFMALASLLF